MPILWYYHDILTQQNALQLIILMLIASLMLCGVVGTPAGAALSGMYYRYWKRDRGEMELYETILDEKSEGKSKVDKLME
jgi:hypothetical protein